MLEQVIDCSGGDEVNEETGGRRKAAALLQVLRAQVGPGRPASPHSLNF